MTEREITLKRIAERLSSYVTYIRLMTKDNYNDAAVDAENSFMQLLNAVYGWNLVNANAVEQNAAGIDLIDHARKLIVQVSTSANSQKIKHTEEEIQKVAPRYEGFTLKYLFIVESYRPQAEVEVIDLTRLHRDIDALSDEKVKEVDALASRFFTLSIFDNNEDYKRKIGEQNELEKKIEITRKKVKKYPDDQDFADELQDYLNTYNAKKEELEQDRQAIFNLVQRIACIQGQVISDRMKRAIDAFNKGDVSNARIILDEAEHDNVNHADLYLKTEAAAKAHLKNAITAIEEQSFKTSVIMAEVNIPINDRIHKALTLWQTIDTDAQKIDYATHEADKNEKLLHAYVDFLQQYGHFANALTIEMRLLKIREARFGKEHIVTAKSYDDLGYLLNKLGQQDNALSFHQRALEIRQNVLGHNHQDTATSYNNIGGVHHQRGNYSDALKYYMKALSILNNTLGPNHQQTAAIFNNLGGVHHRRGNYSDALKYYMKALPILVDTLGPEHPHTAISYNNIGWVYWHQGDNHKALECFEKALAILEKVLGHNHPHTKKVKDTIESVKSKISGQ